MGGGGQGLISGEGRGAYNQKFNSISLLHLFPSVVTRYRFLR